MAGLLPHSRIAGSPRFTPAPCPATVKPFSFAALTCALPPSSAWYHVVRSRGTAACPAAAQTASSLTTTRQNIQPATWKEEYDEHNLSSRHQQVMRSFPTALGVDDWISRVEAVLSGYGFTGDNSIAMTNLCRDEVTAVLKDKIESVFGSSFNTNGLGGMLTCGATGMGAGLSHSPICENGRERYVFFSFPHIAINSKGEVGSISRPGRAGSSCACGALAKCLGEFQAEGYVDNCKVPGVHDPLDPEYSILKQRLARRLRQEGTPVSQLTLAEITAAAERTITSDLEFLIDKAVDVSKADYAVVTGIQIHNWSTQLTPEGAPSMEFVAPTKFYIVIDGEKIELDMTRVPSLSPRQLMVMASSSIGDGSAGKDGGGVVTRATGTTLQAIPLDYLIKELGGAALGGSSLVAPSIGEHELTSRWQADIETQPTPSAWTGVAPTMDTIDSDYNTSFFARQMQVVMPEVQEPQTLSGPSGGAIETAFIAPAASSASSNGEYTSFVAADVGPTAQPDAPMPSNFSIGGFNSFAGADAATSFEAAVDAQVIPPQGPFSILARSIDDAPPFSILARSLDDRPEPVSEPAAGGYSSFVAPESNGVAPPAAVQAVSTPVAAEPAIGSFSSFVAPAEPSGVPQKTEEVPSSFSSFVAASPSSVAQAKDEVPAASPPAEEPVNTSFSSFVTADTNGLIQPSNFVAADVGLSFHEDAKGPYSILARPVDDSPAPAAAAEPPAVARSAAAAAPAAAPAPVEAPKPKGAFSGLKAWWYTLAAAGGNTSESS